MHNRHASHKLAGALPSECTNSWQNGFRLFSRLSWDMKNIIRYWVNGQEWVQVRVVSVSGVEEAHAWRRLTNFYLFYSIGERQPGLEALVCIERAQGQRGVERGDGILLQGSREAVMILARLRLMASELIHLIREHKLYFLAPVVLMLLGISVLFFKGGAAVLISFIDAGV
jgi:hypothetical protein